ncbi:MAG: site-2 protease family protein [Planctomycetes bacterium]|nr:site-2 protease family protein [Planctomycetota bacterium]
MDIDIPRLVAYVVVLVLSASIHEAMHAFIAYDRGDTTAADLGRLTLNPLKHLDVANSLVLPLVTWFATFGAVPLAGAKPVPVNPYHLRRPERDFAFVAVAGPLTNLSLAFFGAMVLVGIILLVPWIDRVSPFAPHSTGTAMVGVISVLQLWVSVNMGLAMFNLIPIPPLDGSRVFRMALPAAVRERFDALERYGFAPVVVLMVILNRSPTIGAWVGEYWFRRPTTFVVDLATTLARLALSVTGA